MAHFGRPAGLTYADGSLYVLDGTMDPGAMPSVFSRITEPSGTRAILRFASRISLVLIRPIPWSQSMRTWMWSDAAWSGTMLLVGHPHSAYLQAYLDMGLLGLVLLLAYFVTVWRGFRDLGSNGWLSPSMRGFFQ